MNSNSILRWRPVALALVLPAIAGACASIASEQVEAVDRSEDRSVSFDAQGTIKVTGLSVPQSVYLTSAAKKQAIEFLITPYPRFAGDIDEVRKAYDDLIIKPSLEAWRNIYPVDIETRTIGGVQTEVVTPASGVSEENEDRVLIAVHGGAFMIGAYYGAQATAVPVAGRGKITVVSVDYRMAPEHRHPAAIEDVVAVYEELRKTYPAEKIGIYGCSAGGAITAQTIAALLEQGNAPPGAAGVLCAGAGINFGSGDSAYIGPALSGSEPPSADAASPETTPFVYFHGADLSDPVISPMDHPDILGRFPPTLLVTGTRDTALSPALITHQRLLALGAESTLYVQEGMGHNHFNMFAGTEEASQAYDVIWSFFDRNLDR